MSTTTQTRIGVIKVIKQYLNCPLKTEQQLQWLMQQLILNTLDRKRNNIEKLDIGKPMQCIDNASLLKIILHLYCHQEWISTSLLLFRVARVKADCMLRLGDVGETALSKIIRDKNQTLQERMSRLASGVALIRWVYYFKSSRP